MERANEHFRFRSTWRNPRGLAALSEVNNQPIGLRFMVTSLVFFFLGGVMALLMRVQLTVSENTFIDPQLYNELFTMHGSTMMFLFAVPFLEGLALYLTPMMIGSRDVAFPRLSAFSYWSYLFGGMIFYASFLFGSAPDAGWFAYTPLSGARFSDIELDFFLLGLAMVEIAGIGAAIEIVVSILKFRASGMSINRIPIFIWTVLVVGIMIIIAFTVLVVATVMLELDRAIGTHFFTPEAGGNSLLWQHLFWFFGHPDVYIMFLPATGVVSMIIPVFARRPLAVYALVVVAIMITAFLSFGLWVHHMYATGLPTLSMNFFAAASLMIAVASGIQVFAWIGTMWGQPVRYSAPMLYVLGFFFIFVLGGMTGVMIAVVPFDWQVHDTYFIVAHFHYVLIGGVVFPILGALHYWFPKVTGRMLGEKSGRWAFWLTFLGFNIAFFPMHIMGFLGMPRRVYTYSSELELDGYNIVSTFGAFMLAAGFMIMLANMLWSWRRGARAGDDPWGGETLEWSITSPPPSYSFLTPPVVHSRHPLWREAQMDESQRSQRARKALAGRPEQWRGTLITDAVTAEPQAVQWLPSPSYLPLFTAISLLVSFCGVLFESYSSAMFGLMVTVGFVVRWLWPTTRKSDMLEQSEIEEAAGLPVFATGSKSVAWWGMIWLLVCLGTAAVTLSYSYFFTRMLSDTWPQDDLPLPELIVPAVSYGLLLLAGGSAWLANRAVGQQHRKQAHAFMGTSFMLGVGFLGLTAYVLDSSGVSHQANAYGSFFHVLNWMVAMYVATAMALSIATHVRLVVDGTRVRSYTPLIVQLTAMFWYFTAAASALVFATIFLSPHVI